MAIKSLSRDQTIWIIFLVVLSSTILLLLGTGKLNLSGLKSDVLNQQSCNQQSQQVQKRQYNSFISLRYDTQKLIESFNNNLQAIEAKIVKFNIDIANKNIEISTAKKTLEEIESYLRNNCGGMQNRKNIASCTQKQKQKIDLEKNIRAFNASILQILTYITGLNNQKTTIDEHIAQERTRMNQWNIFIIQYETCGKELQTKPTITSSLISGEIKIISGEINLVPCQTKIISGEIGFISGKIQAPLLISGEVLRVKSNSMEFSVKPIPENNIDIREWRIEMDGIKMKCNAKQISSLLPEIQIICPIIPSSTIEPGNESIFKLIGTLGYIDSPLIVTTKFVKFTYNGIRTDIIDETNEAKLSYDTKSPPIQLHKVEKIGDTVEINYCKNSNTCVDLYDFNNKKLNTEKFCANIGNLKLPKNNFLEMQNGTKVRLKYEDREVWSNERAVFGECVPDIIPPEIEDIDGDGQKDGYDIYLKEEIAGGRINPDLLHRVRTLVLDTKGNSINSDTDIDSKMYEFNNGINIKDWKTKYQKKGHMRSVCDPPMLNISFDKFTSGGQKKELFKGRSTIPGKPILEYQEIRVIPICDATAYYGGWSDPSWFDGTVNRQLGEYFIFSTLRNIGVSTVDVIDFSKLSFLNAEEKYRGKKYDYMFLQRDNEEDDEVSFTKQFGLETDLIEDGKINKWYGDWDGSPYDRLYSILMRDAATNTNISMRLEKNNALKYALMTGFAQIGDRGTLHNEDYGKITNSDLWRTIPYGFDLSMYQCQIDNFNTVSELRSILNQIMSIPDDTERNAFLEAYYRNAKEIFSNQGNLYKMLATVDQYPFEEKNGVGKKRLKEYIKIRFSEYKKYIESEEFAQITGQSYTAPICTSSFPFNSQESQRQMREDFNQVCGVLKPAPDATISNINLRPITVIKIDDWTWVGRDDEVIHMKNYTLGGNLALTITAGEKDIKIPKNNAFIFSPMVIKSADEEVGVYMQTNYLAGTNMVDEPGPYYILPAGKSSIINTAISGNIQTDGSEITPGVYTLMMTGIRFNPYTNIFPITENNTTTVTI